MSDSNVYTAERILAKRKHNGITQYFIKWKGYSLKESTWEPAENILDRGLLTAFESSRNNKSSSSSSAILNSSGTSSNSTSSNNESHSTTSTKRGRGRPRKSYTQQRQEQVRLQRHIEQQQQKTQLRQVDKKQLVVFNPVGSHSLPVVEEIVYEPELTKDPILVTDVTTKDLTVTISECKTPEGFFRT